MEDRNNLILTGIKINRYCLHQAISPGNEIILRCLHHAILAGSEIIPHCLHHAILAGSEIIPHCLHHAILAGSGTRFAESGSHGNIYNPNSIIQEKLNYKHQSSFPNGLLAYHVKVLNII